MSSSGDASITTARASLSEESQWLTRFAMTKPPPPLTTTVFEFAMSACHPAAVDHQVDAGDIGCEIAGEEQRGVGHVLRPAEARPRRAPARVVEHGGVGIIGLAGDDLARRHGVADDEILGVVDRDLAGKVDAARLADAIGDIARRG